MTLDTMTVSGQAIDTTDWPAVDVLEALGRYPTLSLRPQGTAGGQVDMSVRGSSFSGAGLMLENLALRTPQTEHFHAQVPFPAAFLQVEGVATGVEQLDAGAGHLVGSAVARFADATEGGALSVSAFEGGGMGLSGHTAVPLKDTWAVQFGGESLWRAGGEYAQNDVARRGGGVRFFQRASEGRVDFALGYRQMAIGARGLYGVDAEAYPTAFEWIDDWALAGAWRCPTEKGGDWRVAGVMRWIQDEYVLKREAPDFYRNDTLSRHGALVVERRPSEDAPRGVLWRLGVEDERVDGTGLGKHDRQRVDATVLPQLRLGDWALRVGGTLVGLSEGRPEWLGSGAVERRIAGKHRVRAALVQTVRQPSYTELNYESPASLGNQGLANQRATEAEFTWRARWGAKWETELVAFRRWSRNTVDWVRDDAADRWQATDLGGVRTDGLEARATRRSEDWAFEVLAAWLSKEGDKTPVASRYVFDYPEQRVSCMLNWRVARGVRVRCVSEWQQYAANPARSGAESGVLGTLEIRSAIGGVRGGEACLSITNFWNEDIQALPGQPSPGRRMQVTFRKRW